MHVYKQRPHSVRRWISAGGKPEFGLISEKPTQPTGRTCAILLCECVSVCVCVSLTHAWKCPTQLCACVCGYGSCSLIGDTAPILLRSPSLSSCIYVYCCDPDTAATHWKGTVHPKTQKKLSLPQSSFWIAEGCSYQLCFCSNQWQVWFTNAFYQDFICGYLLNPHVLESSFIKGHQITNTWQITPKYQSWSLGLTTGSLLRFKGVIFSFF